MTDLTDLEKQLVEKAKEARQNAYAPVSNHKVGVAILTENDNIVLGCNVENSKAIPIGTCGEITGLHAARALGFKEFKAIAIASESGASPCGMCREIIQDHNPNMPILIVDTKGTIQRQNIQDLLPNSFVYYKDND